METVVARMLLVCRGIIHNEQRVGNNADDIRGQMAAYMIVLPVADLLSNDNHNIVREALAFLVEILEGGNKQAQLNFLDHFMNSREETFFVDVSTRLKTAISSIQEVLFTAHVFLKFIVNRHACFKNILKKSRSVSVK